MIFKIALLVFKVLHGLAPSYLENLVRVKPEGRYHLRYKDQLLVPNAKHLKTGLSSHRACTVDSLPDNIRQITNIQKFKKELKTFLFRLA